MKEFKCQNFSLELGKKTYIMGILNVTPDSFFDGGNYLDTKNAVLQAEKMIEEGADIIDIGAVSTRPFADRVSADEEWARLKDVLYEIRKRFDVPLSVDTFTPEIAERCLLCGADIINDVSGAFVSEMAETVKKFNAGWIIMHGGVINAPSETFCEYKNGIVNDVNDFFNKMLDSILAFGINRKNICLDVGFGFSKTNEQNIELLKNYQLVEKNGLPLLCALSRKRFIGEMTGAKEPCDRLAGTLAANVTAIIKGADIIRVHDIKMHKQSIDVLDRLYI